MTIVESNNNSAMDAAALTGELHGAVTALAALDADGLEAMEQRIRTVTAAHLAQGRKQLPELMEKHALLGQLLAVTAANLKVLVSVLHLETRLHPETRLHRETRMETR